MHIIYVDKALGKAILECVIPLVYSNILQRPILHLVKTNLSPYLQGVKRDIVTNDIQDTTIEQVPVFIFTDEKSNDFPLEQLRASKDFSRFDFHVVNIPDIFEEIFISDFDNLLNQLDARVDKGVFTAAQLTAKERIEKLLQFYDIYTYGDPEFAYQGFVQKMNPAVLLSGLCPSIKPICTSLNAKCETCTFKIAI